MTTDKVNPLAALADVEAYLAEREDVSDGSYGIPEPNEEMTLLRQLREAMEALAMTQDKTRDRLLLDGLCMWLLHRFGPDSPEGREAQCRLNPTTSDPVAPAVEAVTPRQLADHVADALKRFRSIDALLRNDLYMIFGSMKPLSSRLPQGVMWKFGGASRPGTRFLSETEVRMDGVNTHGWSREEIKASTTPPAQGAVTDAMTKLTRNLRHRAKSGEQQHGSAWSEGVRFAANRIEAALTAAPEDKAQRERLEQWLGTWADSIPKQAYVEMLSIQSSATPDSVPNAEAQP